jgi:hypothetical protein
MQDTTRTKAATMVEEAIGRLHRLHATGPNPFDYWLWADETVQALETIFGADAEETRAIAEIVYERGRTANQRGAMDNMTLGIHGEWGIHARLDRAEPVLEGVHRRLTSDA